ncbi:MAG: hypothetical protein PVI23_02860 [Maricaulaceae bacterium]|jgi:hypothetical protein
MGIFTYFPLLAIPVIIYNLMAFGGAVFSAGGSIAQRLLDPILSLPMPSSTEVVNAEGVSESVGTVWDLTSGDLLLVLALVLLFFELLKSTGTGRASIVNHALSLIIFIVCLVEFLVIGPFATSVFFLITIMALLDLLAGVVVTIVAARRDFAVGEGGFN